MELIGVPQFVYLYGLRETDNLKHRSVKPSLHAPSPSFTDTKIYYTHYVSLLASHNLKEVIFPTDDIKFEGVR